MKLLHIDAGITGPGSASRHISAAVVNALTAADPTLQVVRRDLDADPIRHLDSAGLATLADNEVLREFLEADVLVIGAPMYNFGMASQLKSWFDHILVAGRTFRYGPNGPEGLAGGKKVIIASARGGVYAPGAPSAAADFHEPHLLQLLRFIGIEDVAIVRAEGLALGPEAREAALSKALADAANVPATLTAKLVA
ncbi:FMN-dependent NADH-azoreductase [Phenylobacterium deserti]|uniref:FMN dependent NADH:quinone oxidoreductase n=1 Tax=Phenylobacterium deserti TaxID=1914756 RepID=A0A328A8J8_9CAUL|nr:NAD(P)H-dependent oxidoreductase [Phenylobacterium deserti]RAK50870.1 FMN-dependent NADH-azoreductase [Phenylobacterium deserti]